MTASRPAILHVVTGLRTGGTERALHRLVEHGLAQAFDTHIVSMEDEGTFGPRLREAGATVHVLGMRGNPLPGIAKLRRIARTVRPALVQGWMYHGNLGALVAGWTAPGKVPMLWNIRQSLDDIAAEKPMTLRVIRLNRLLSRRAARIVYNSHRSREQHEAFGFSSAHGMLIPNGFELDRFAPDPATRLRLRTEMGVAPDTPLIGNFGRFHPVKDHAGLLRAANLALAAGLDAEFLLAGTDISAESIGLQALVDPRFHSRFHIFGDRSDVPAMMQAIDLYVSSSRAEAFPNVVGEAMAASVPCIGTHTGDTAYVIGDAGIVVPPSDPDALAAALLDLGRDAAKRHALGRVARRIVEEQFDIDAVVDRYITLYQRVLGTLREI
jgi:glycosyltransferase involved in cell wall biosynthesis